MYQIHPIFFRSNVSGIRTISGSENMSSSNEVKNFYCYKAQSNERSRED